MIVSLDVPHAGTRRTMINERISGGVGKRNEERVTEDWFGPRPKGTGDF